MFLQVIRTLDPKQNQGAAPEIQALKNQLQERDRLFHSLEVSLHCTVKYCPAIAYNCILWFRQLIANIFYIELICIFTCGYASERI